MARETPFQDIIDKMPKYMKMIEGCEAIPMYTDSQRRALRRRLPATKGVYVMYEGERPMYVGRSDNLATRLLEHGQPSGGSETASFAFNIAKEEFPNTCPMSRKDLQRNEEFQSHFDIAKERVRKMKVRVVGVANPIEQTILEVYAHMELDTPYNSFENH